MKVKRRPHPNTVHGSRYTTDHSGEKRRTGVPMGTNKGEGTTGKTAEKRRREECHGNARSCVSHR